jgi:solute carrier family 25 protein 16
MVPYAGVSFLTWGFLRAHFVLDEPGKTPSTPIADLTIGAISGAIAQTVSYPFEVVRRRMQVGGIARPDRWLSWKETVMEILKGRGWRGFFVGLGIGYLKMIPMTSVSFAVWQSMKRVLDL